MKRICKRCNKREHVETGKVRIPSEYCNYCRIYLGGIEARKRKLREHKCLDCGKEIKPVTCPHCEKIVSYTIRCKKCLKKRRKK